MLNGLINGFIKGFIGFWAVYFFIMFNLNVMLWFVTDESEEFYQPIWNVFNLM